LFAANRKAPVALPLAIFASHPDASRGRLHVEQESQTRTRFQRDRDRIVHSGAFRKLQFKTQVFVYHEGDYFRTRLTHSLEVAQIARSISRSLGLNEDLAEALALAHDLGHTPFGHAGEDALRAAMKPYGGFDHNEQTFRILTKLEERYAGFDGLNLTWETLEGVVKHNGPLSAPRPTLVDFSTAFDLELDTLAGPEAQVAALADDIAYNNHDIDDGLRAGLFEIEELLDLPLVGEVFRQVQARYPGLERGRLIHEAIRRLIDRMVTDLVTESAARLTKAQPNSAADIRALSAPVVAFSDEMKGWDAALRAFLFRRMYRHYRVNRMTSKVKRVVAELFDFYLGQPNCLPDTWRRRVETTEDGSAAARVVADYIAGMTDRYALEAHEKLFNPYQRI